MKRSLLAAAAMLLAAPATAGETLAVSGYWKAFRTISTDTKPTCGMRSDIGSEAGLLIKYYLGDAYLTGQVIKASWDFPATGTIEIPLTIGVDRNPILSGNGYGYPNMSPAPT